MARKRNDPNQPDLFSILDGAGGDGDRSGDPHGGADGVLDRSGPARGVDGPSAHGVHHSRSGQDQLDGGQHGRDAVGAGDHSVEPPPQRADAEPRDQGGAAGGGSQAGRPDGAEQRTLRTDRDRRDPAAVGDPRPDPGPGTGGLGAALDEPRVSERAHRGPRSSDRPPVAGPGLLGTVSDQGGLPAGGPDRGRPDTTRPPRRPADRRTSADDLQRSTNGRAARTVGPQASLFDDFDPEETGKSTATAIATEDHLDEVTGADA